MDKPIGIEKKEYEEAQRKKHEENFMFQTNQAIQYLKNELEKLSKSLAASIATQGSDKVCFDIQLSHANKSMSESLKSFKGDINQLQITADVNRRMLNQVLRKEEDFISKTEHQEKISRLEEKIRLIHLERDLTKQSFIDLFNALKADFELRLQKHKEEVLNRPSDVPELKKSFDQKLELVELNGQNSILRSSNNEKQIQLIDRKIENIYQLIKKIELTKQESL